MPTTRIFQIFTWILLIALCTACIPTRIGDMLATSPSTLESTSTPAPVQLPAATKKPQHGAKTPSGGGQGQGQSNNASQNLTFNIPAHPFDVILGRPTANSIALSLLAYEPQTFSIAYGTTSGSYTAKTGSVKLNANVPQTVELSNLQPDTPYYYAIEGVENTFHTARASGAAYTFTIQADSHLDSNSNPQVYLQTLTNEKADKPDFVIDLGDTFMTEKYKPYTAASAQYLAQRYYFSQVAQTAPLFLTLGNHDGEGASHGNSANEMSDWATRMRTAYFPNPVPDGFYMGNSTPDKTVGYLQDYYAWQWGDALFVVLDPYWYTPPQQNATDQWIRSLGSAQYQWLKNTLENSHAPWKFVFIHQLVGGLDQNGRGGVEAAGFYEWGGKNADGTWGFTEHRPGWDMPIHQLLVANHVTAVFHGHDHLFAKQELDGIIYQEVPQPSAARSNNTGSAVQYGYVMGDILGSSGHLRVTVSPAQVAVEYVRAYLAKDEKPGQQNGQVDAKYTLTH